MKYVEIVSNGTEAWGADASYGIRVKVEVAGALDVPGAADLLRQKVSVLVDDCVKATLLHAAQNDPKSIERREQTKRNLVTCFDGPIHVKEVPNGYWHEGTVDAWMSPWLWVTTSVGVIQIGWRKRVIQISWDFSDVTASADDLFPTEDVTKEGRMIHAWPLEKAKAYVATIVAAKP